MQHRVLLCGCSLYETVGRYTLNPPLLSYPGMARTEPVPDGLPQNRPLLGLSNSFQEASENTTHALLQPGFPNSVTYIISTSVDGT